MDECKVCANADNEYCFACDNGSQFKPMTNADRIRAMSDEELAKEVLCGERWFDEKEVLKWLKSPVEVDNG